MSVCAPLRYRCQPAGLLCRYRGVWESRLDIAIDVQKKIRERDGMDWTQHERYGMPIARHPNHATLGRRYLS
jgi:hypothetical protein